MIKRFGAGLLGSCSYLLYDSKEAMLIDCGVECTPICDFLTNQGLSLKYIVLTHGHFDHAEYFDKYASIFPDATLICHTSEVPLLRDSVSNATALLSHPHAYEGDFHTVEEGDSLRVGQVVAEIMHTPGHTPGGICLLARSEGAILVGDTLFKGGYGRTDLKGGDFRLLSESLKRILSLDASLSVYPGHGDSTTIGEERDRYFPSQK